MDDKTRDALAKPFPPEKVKQKQGQGRRTMSYISHGLITERLNEVDPSWTLRPIATYTYTDANGRTHCEGVEIELTVCGVSRVEAGGPQRQDGFANEIKNAYSDALKRAAMRFGIALSMWESLVDAEGDEDTYPDQQPTPAPQRRAPQPPAPASIRPAAQPPALAGNPPGGEVRMRELLDAIRDDLADPKVRKKALHEYYGEARTVAGLNQGAEHVAKSGMPEADLKAAYRYHHNRLSAALAPASFAG